MCLFGWVFWSFWFVEGVIFGCIFVIIVDDIVFFFVDVILWEKIGVFVEEKDVFILDKILCIINYEEVFEK